MEDKVAGEIDTLHRFFVAWFKGELPNTDDAFAEGFTAHLAPSFHYVMPGGARFDLDGIGAALRGAHGSNPDFAIAISDVRVHAHQGGLVVASYIEWQSGAKASAADNGRISTVVFAEDAEAPRGLRWMHIQETWVPAEQLADNPLLA